MTGTERKRRWRLENPERSREHERRRALLRRRHGTWIEGPDGKPILFSYPSGISYQLYEEDPYPSMEPDKQPGRDAWYQRVSAGHGRKASRFREWQKRNQKAIESLDAQIAELDAKLAANKERFSALYEVQK